MESPIPPSDPTQSPSKVATAEPLDRNGDSISSPPATDNLPDALPSQESVVKNEHMADSAQTHIVQDSIAEAPVKDEDATHHESLVDGKDNAVAREGGTPSEDSEAETEILSGRTPRKQHPARPSAPADHHDQESNSRPSSPKKRTASGQLKGRHTDESEPAQDNEHSHKKPRLSPPQEDDSDNEDGPIKPRLRLRKAESESRVPNVRDENLGHGIDLPRAVTLPPKSNLHPPPHSPVLRSSHRKDSSAQNSAPPQDLEPRPSRKSIDPDDEPSPSTSEPPTKRGSRVDMSSHHNSMPRPKNVDRNGRSPLARASHDGDLARVFEYIESSPETLNKPDYAGNTPLPLAVAKGHVKVCRALINAGADVNNVNFQGETPLQDAIDRSDIDVIGLLRPAGAILKPLAKVKEENPGLPRHRRHFQHLHSRAALIEHISTANEEGIEDCMMAEVKADNECVIAAICGPKPDYVELMLASGGEADPDPEEVDNKTPMLVAIECGHFNAVELLLANGADPRRRLFKKDYRRLCRELGGQDWEKVYVKLVKAYGEEEPSTPEEIPASPPDKNGQADEDAIEEVDEEKLRQEYLDSLPLAVSKALGSDGIPTYPMPGKEKRHFKTLYDWQPIYPVRLKDIDDACDPEREDELWMLSVTASVFLAHRRLDQVAEHVSETIPASKFHRKIMWQNAQLWDFAVKDCLYQRAPFSMQEELLQQNGIPFTLLDGHTKMVVYDWQSVERKELRKWLHLPEDQVFWIKVDDFCDLTTPEKCPRLKSFSIRFEPSLKQARLLKRRVLPLVPSQESS